MKIPGLGVVMVATYKKTLKNRIYYRKNNNYLTSCISFLIKKLSAKMTAAEIIITFTTIINRSGKRLGFEAMAFSSNSPAKSPAIRFPNARDVKNIPIN